MSGEGGGEGVTNDACWAQEGLGSADVAPFGVPDVHHVAWHGQTLTQPIDLKVLIPSPSSLCAHLHAGLCWQTCFMVPLAIGL